MGNNVVVLCLGTHVAMIRLTPSGTLRPHRKGPGMAETIFDPSRIDFDRPGRHNYEVAFPLDGDWGHVLLPLTVINGLAGKGKGVACFGGTHGDEYEGQVAARRLTLDLRAEEIEGRVLIIPRLNPPASDRRKRSSPLDGVNMNRAFPGDPKGTISYRVADFVSSCIFPQVDVVLDHHAGGSPMDFAQLTSFHYVEDPKQRAEIRKVASLYDTPLIFVYSSEIASGLLTEEAERQGKITIGGEFGHGGGVGHRGIQHVYLGTQNVLKHYGMIPGDIVRVDPQRKDPPRLVEALQMEDYVPAPFTGVFEPAVALGDRVEDKQIVGRMHNFERPDERPLDIPASHAGYLAMCRFHAPVQKGDTILVVTREVSE